MRNHTQFLELTINENISIGDLSCACTYSCQCRHTGLQNQVASDSCTCHVVAVGKQNMEKTGNGRTKNGPVPRCRRIHLGWGRERCKSSVPLISGDHSCCQNSRRLTCRSSRRARENSSEGLAKRACATYNAEAEAIHYLVSDALT
jgi:hypothetical protein